jgi:anti-sigma factor RsiW
MHLEELVIVDYVDGALDEAGRAGVERHLSGCDECRRVVEDFREIRRVAGTLEHREPPARAWSRIERAIRIEAQERGTNAGAADRLRGARSWMGRPLVGWLAAAAVVMIAVAAGIRYGGTTVPNRADAPREQARPSAVADGSPSAEAIAAELSAAEAHYDKAIKGLEQIATAEQGALDPNTAATLQKNLAVIDQAISESRAAVVAQPASEPARDSLLESFRTKLALLQDTVALINEMRKGNEAGAARVVSGLKQKGD